MQTTVTSRATAATVGLLLALAACSPDDDASTGAESPTSASTQDSGEPVSTEDSREPAGSETTEIAIDDFRFDPEAIEVQAGTEVVWTNEDGTAHTVTAGSEGSPEAERFDLDVTKQGDTVSHTFDEPGTYAYFCELHPFMTATVEVRE